MTNSGDAAVRNALHTLADDAPATDAGLYERVAARVHQRYRRRRALLTSAAGLVVVAIGLTLAVITASQSDIVRQPSANGLHMACPETFGAWIHGPQRPGTDTTFVPGVPLSAVVCRYDRSSAVAPDSAMRLTKSGYLSGPTLRNLVTSLNALPYGVMRCPANVGSGLMVRFHYSTGPDVDAFLGVGCANGSNGSWNAVVFSVTVPGFVQGVPPSR